jgi:hypothetical protein
MKAFRTSAAVLALTSGLLALSAQAEVVQQNASGDPLYTVEAPKGYAMIGDLVIARPAADRGHGDRALQPSSSAYRSLHWAVMSVKLLSLWWSNQVKKPSCVAWAAPAAATSETDPLHRLRRASRLLLEARGRLRLVPLKG